MPDLCVSHNLANNLVYSAIPDVLCDGAVWTHLFALCSTAGTPIPTLSTRAHDAMGLADVCLLSTLPRGTKSWFFVLDSEIVRVAHNTAVPSASCFTNYVISEIFINPNIKYNKVTVVTKDSIDDKDYYYYYYLNITGFWVLPLSFRNSSLFTATCKISPSVRCVSAAKRLCTDIDSVRKPTVFSKQILR
jgi:hypothetical protein